MYVTAHLVKSRDQREGINAFLHVHGAGFAWPDDASLLPETSPGKTVLHHTDLPPGGNQIRAYLDIVAPDRTPRAEIDQALTAFSQDLRERRNPTVFRHGVITIRFGVELGLEGLRAQQLEMLTLPALQLIGEHG
ncbi:MAG TPA: hypothetical protein VHW23_01030 [Kofleriaceae bacterium]|jgi:hypothetical protein|nr:hypothetical protein [Kofleriaceae bacterium]